MLELQVVVVQLARPVELELAPRERLVRLVRRAPRERQVRLVRRAPRERQVQQEQPGQRLRAQLALQARPEKV